MLKCNWNKTKKASDLNMSITYNIEICNGKIENLSVFAEKIFKDILEVGRIIVRDQLEILDEQLMENRDSKRYQALKQPINSENIRKTSFPLFTILMKLNFV